jgi:hypothetical protein
MADKRFHMTPDGPELCKPRFKRCQIERHYASPEFAVSNEAIIAENTIHLAEIKRLEDLLRNCPPEKYSRSAFAEMRGNDSARRFGDGMDARMSDLGVKPEVYYSGTTFRLNNGNGMEVNLLLTTKPRIHKGFACLVPEWRFIVTSNKVGLHRHPEKVREGAFDLSSTEAIQTSMPEVYKLFRTTAISSGLYNEDKANQRADEMMAHFKMMFNAIESEAVGDFVLWERGMGYFAGSDNATIVVNEDYKTSAFRAENVRRYLAEHPLFQSRQPSEVEIRVSDAHSRTGASWAIKLTGSQWAVEKGYEDGSTEVILLTTPQEALDGVYYHVLAHINPDDKEKALEKGRYAYDLMAQVDEAFKRQETVIDEYWKEEDARKERLMLDQTPPKGFFKNRK